MPTVSGPNVMLPLGYAADRFWRHRVFIRFLMTD